MESVWQMVRLPAFKWLWEGFEMEIAIGVAVLALAGTVLYTAFYKPQIGVNVRDEKNDWTLLMQAARDGDAKAIRELLKAGVDANARDVYGVTALIRAAGNGHTEVIRELLKAGVNLDEAALMGAALNGHTKVIKELLKAGADIEARNNIFGETALMGAAHHGQTEAIRELLKAGADKRTSTNDDDGLTAFDMWEILQKDHPDFQEISDLLRP